MDTLFHTDDSVLLIEFTRIYLAFFIPLSLCFIRIALFLKIEVRRQVSFSQGTSIAQVGGTIWRLNFLEWLFGSFVLRVYLFLSLMTI